MELFAIVVLILAMIFAGLIYGTVKKTDWGINFSPVHCPKCGTRVPFVRAPKSTNQAMWGGHTCPKCGTQMDKWGRALPSAPHSPA